MIIYPKSFKHLKRMVKKSKKDLQRTVFKHLVIEPKVIFDIGANIGAYSYLFSKQYPNSNIYSFEPVVDNFNNLVKNMEHSNIKNVTPYNYGFYKECAELELGVPIIDEKDSRGGTYRFVDTQEELTNKVLSKFMVLDEYVSENNITEIDILKLDVEGAEKDVFKGGKNALKITKMLHIELWHDHLDMIDYLESSNFKLVGRYRQNRLFERK